MKHIIAPTEWLDHGFTVRLRKSLVEDQATAFTSLVGACRSSQDPQVTRRLAEWEQLGSFLKQLERVNAHGADDGSADGDD